MIDIEIRKKVFEDLVVLENIDLGITDGEFFIILGPSGCGKSTLLRSIGGFEKFDGYVKIDGLEITQPRKDIVMVFQDFNQLFPWKTVLNNVTFALNKINGHNHAENKERALQFLEVVGLTEFKEYYPHQLSGGMKQRVAIARALAVQPKVLLMDEPFASLDAQTRTILQSELLNLWHEFKITIVFVTHNIQEAIILGDRILVMSSSPGRVKHLYKNELDRPRRPDKQGFTELWHQLYEDLDQKRFTEVVK